MIRYGSRILGSLGGVLAVAGICCVARGADAGGDLEAQYQSVLGVMKKPAVTGVLVTEVEPGSAAAAAGLRGGDIITEYYGTKITTLRNLRDQVAEAMAREEFGNATGSRVVLRARRGKEGAEMVAIQLPREPVGIRAIEVEAGVPGPRIPVANLRGTLALDWKQVIETAGAEKEAGGAAMKTFVKVEAEAETMPAGGVAGGVVAGTKPMFEEVWIGWQVSAAGMEGTDAMGGTLEVYRIVPAAQETTKTEQSSYRFRMRVGDYQNTPAFVLEEAGARYVTADFAAVNVSVKRVGGALRTEAATTGEAAVAGAGGVKPKVPAGEGEHRDFAAPLNAIVQPALPFVAAAMPHEANGVLGVYLVSLRDFLPRPGYVLETEGKQRVPGMEGDGWRVDLKHCGVLVESYWFTDQRKLLCMESAAVQPVISRRVVSVRAAESRVEGRGKAGAETGPAGRGRE